MLPVPGKKLLIAPLLLAGASGQPRHVRLRSHHPIGGCACPSFSLSDYDFGSDDRESYEGAMIDPWIYAVFPDNVPNAHQFEASKFLGATRYELTGYFSGRLIDFYQWAAAQNNEHEQPIGGDDESDRRARYAEFCVEDWCYRPDPTPVLHKEVLSPAEIAADRAAYARVLSDMKRAGAKLCANH
ncbi:MAG TPA: hypothetical protein VER11_26140 [Polyangiaceae bacterium]|nr:hypothetical protein [Polyangiaceae bacterium]